MKDSHHGRVTPYHYDPTPANFRDAALKGLLKHAKTLPCKFSYDERGAQLFEDICRVEEYYPTRAETAILARHAGEIGALIGPRCRLVELGSGSSTKTPLLLDA